MHSLLQSIPMRALQHISHAAEEYHDHDHQEPYHDHDHGHTKSQASTLHLRIIAMVVILIGGLVGVVPPIVGRWMSSPDSRVSRTIRAFSGGAILGLALIHIIPEGMEQLGEASPEYPVGGIAVAAGLVMLMFLDYMATYLLAGRQLAKQQHKEVTTSMSTLHTCCPVSNGNGAAALQDACTARDVSHKAGAVDGDAIVVMPANVGVAATGVSPFAHSHHHLPACHITTIKHYVACYSMELGCIFHSVIIGVSIGAITTAPRLLLTLTAVMAFHQALEGLALGSVLALTQLSLLKKAVMSAVYALSMPLGIALGIAVAGTFDPDSLANMAVQGVLNGVSGGMLLYVSMYHLLAEEFSKTDLLVRPGLAALLAVAVVAGLGSMCVIGIWG